MEHPLLKMRCVNRPALGVMHLKHMKATRLKAPIKQLIAQAVQALIQIFRKPPHFKLPSLASGRLMEGPCQIFTLGDGRPQVSHTFHAGPPFSAISARKALPYFSSLAAPIP